MKTYKNGYVIAILLMLLMVLYVTSSFYTGIASSTVHAVWTAALDRGHSIFTLELLPSNTTAAPDDRTRRMCTNQERKDYIEKMCDTWGSPIIVGGSRLLVDRKYRMMQCAIPKSAGTTWKALWEIANKYKHIDPEKHFNKSQIKPLYVHGQGMRDAGLRFVDLTTKGQYKDYTKFLVVRNPFERIYSAYVNVVFRKPGTPGPSPEVKSYLQKFNIKHGRSNNISLKQFLELLLNDTSDGKQMRYANDRHWQPMTYHCDVCNINYDYIMRSESMNYDSGPILNMLGYPKDFLLSANFNLNRYSTNRTTHKSDISLNKVPIIMPKYLKAYRAIPQDLYNKFVKRYWFDLHLLGYSFDMSEARMECNVKLPSGDVGC